MKAGAVLVDRGSWAGLSGCDFFCGNGLRRQRGSFVSCVCSPAMQVVLECLSLLVAESKYRTFKCFFAFHCSALAEESQIDFLCVYVVFKTNRGGIACGSRVR